MYFAMLIVLRSEYLSGYFDYVLCRKSSALCDNHGVCGCPRCTNNRCHLSTFCPWNGYHSALYITASLPIQHCT